MRFEWKLAGKGLTLAVIIFFAAVLGLATTIVRRAGSKPMNAERIARTIDSEQDHITPSELAQWILENRRDYQLVDIRPEWQYDDYHIPTAINIPLTALFQDASLSRLSHAKKIVLYGFGAGHAAQAELLLALKGYQAYSLRDGIVDWYETVMVPSSIRNDPPNPADYRAAKQLRERFMAAGKPGNNSQGANW